MNQANPVVDFTMGFVLSFDDRDQLGLLVSD
jgi:hypothetical protein